MENFKKIALILSLFILVLPFFVSVCFAAEKGLEVTYPQVPGVETPTTVKTLLPQYVKYIFNFGIWIAGLVAFVSLIYGGVRYLASAGNPASIDDAKDQMFAGILGLIILLSSWLILYNLNPQLVILKAELPSIGTPPPDIPGVYLCKDSTKKECMAYNTDSATLPAELDDQVGYIYFQSNESVVFGAVLHENENQQGTCKVYLGEGSVDLPNGKPSSITVFQRGTASGEGVTLYECKDYDTENLTGGVLGIGAHKCQRWPTIGGYQDVWNNSLGYNLKEKGRSIKIIEEKKYLAVLFQGENGTQKCEIFKTSDPDLASNYIGDCGNGYNMGCFTSIIVLPIK